MALYSHLAALFNKHPSILQIMTPPFMALCYFLCLCIDPSLLIYQFAVVLLVRRSAMAAPSSPTPPIPPGFLSTSICNNSMQRAMVWNGLRFPNGADGGNIDKDQFFFHFSMLLLLVYFSTITTWTRSLFPQYRFRYVKLSHFGRAKGQMNGYTRLYALAHLRSFIAERLQF